MRVKPIESTEAEIQKACIQFLNTLYRVKVWRQNTGAFALGGTAKRFVRFGQVGQSDITGVGPRGRRIEIEVKRPGNNPTPDQQAWLSMILEFDGIAFCVHSIDECIESARIWGLS